MGVVLGGLEQGLGAGVVDGGPRQRAQQKPARRRVSQQHVSLMQCEQEDFCRNYWFHIPAATQSCQPRPPESGANDSGAVGGGGGGVG